MKKKLLILTLVLCFASTLSAQVLQSFSKETLQNTSTSQKTQWIKVSQAKGIRVYEKGVGTAQHQMRGVMTDSTSLEVVAQVLLDIENYPRWLENLQSSRIVKHFAENDFLVYSYFKMPWPMSDRDLYLRVQINGNPDSADKLSAVLRAYQNASMPAKEGVVRVEKFNARIVLERLSDGGTRGEFTESMDLGGDLPQWMKDVLSSNTPEFVLEKVRSACRNPFYVERAR
jgi:hypothetical protein